MRSTTKVEQLQARIAELESEKIVADATIADLVATVSSVRLYADNALAADCTTPESLTNFVLSMKGIQAEAAQALR